MINQCPLLRFHYASDNEEIPYSSDFWKDGEPNNFGGNENCVVIDNNGEWNDAPCEQLLAYPRFALCQKPGNYQ